MPAPSPPPAAVSPLAPVVTQTSRRALWIIVGLVLVLLILHQDNWFWTDGRLVFGFIPIGLFWHACLSIAASLTWFLTTRIAWPVEPEFEAAVVSDTDSAVHRVEREEVQ